MTQARMHRGLRIGGSLESKSMDVLRTSPYDGKIAGLYDLEDTLGRGHFAVVKLARHVFTGEKVAVKVIDKSKLDDVSKAHLFQEVRCMKLVQHPNVVRLYEVIDTATKLYLILELGDGGDLYDYIMRHDTGLSEQLAKEYFRQIVRAISYCHQLHVVHRDLKPENVVFFEKLGVVKLTDFGFSNKFCPGQKLETSCGSLAYSAPEILLGDSYDAPAVDVWSLGVILYMLVCGQPPFQEANDSETLTMIMDCKYTVPNHVSKDCQDLIARMLVRNPEKRATLAEIAKHRWLTVGVKDNPAHDVQPLISRESLAEEDHNFIVQKIVNGKIATKEEIQESLDKNEYNHITATYYLLAERKLRAKRQETAAKSKRPENLTVPQNSPIPKQDNNNLLCPNPSLLSVPRTPGDVPQRSRKCSIVQEDEEEEDIAGCTGREELVPPLNRRGSRSEGRINLALQERLAESERRKSTIEKEKSDVVAKNIPSKEFKPLKVTPNAPRIISVNQNAGKPQVVNNNQNSAWKSVKTSSVSSAAPIQMNIINNMIANTLETTTTIITNSSTISIPVITTTQIPSQCLPKYKTMPSPTRTTILNLATSPLQLNEIFEEGDGADTQKPRQFVSRTQNRTTYEQRRSKFHKARTASCSSSDASDDDSEKRKKRAHKLNTSSKPIPNRRDSHDDSSDSQEPGTGAGSGGTNRLSSASDTAHKGTSSAQESHKGSSSNTNTGSNGGKKNTTGTNVIIGRRHKAGRRRTGETRLRESQSLNRITEVQEDGTHALVISTTVVGSQGALPPKVKGIGARILQGFNMGSKKSEEKLTKSEDKVVHISRKDTTNKNCLLGEKCGDNAGNPESKDVCNKVICDKTGMKKMKLIGKYFQVHRKLCIPIPGLFSKNKLYKAQSCSSLSRDKINMNSNIMRNRQRAVSVIRNSIVSDDGDINQNMGNTLEMDEVKSTVVQLNNVCNELTGICAIHLGPASKCCSFC